MVEAGIEPARYEAEVLKTSPLTTPAFHRVINGSDV
jgi:hypothetical protein